MKLDGYRESDNVDDRRGMVTGGRVAIGGAGIVIVVAYSLLTHQNPIDVLNRVTQDAPSTTSTRQLTQQELASKRFVSRVLATTEDAWSEQFNHMRRSYTPPRLEIYEGEISTGGCGVGETAVGPFYCPADRMVYLDLEFFAELAQRFGSPGDFAQAYVVAHEVGHHVQNLLGEQGSGRGANGGSVRMELQADCYAGVWGAWAKRHGLLDPGDPAEAIRAATAIGDDTLQRRARGRVAPDSFTHGTSAQRVKWFTRGLQTGDPAQCDTFRARDL